MSLSPGERRELEWQVPDRGGAPITDVGVEIDPGANNTVRIYIDYLTWEGTPNIVLRRPKWQGTMWHRTWVRAIDQFDVTRAEAFHLSQENGRGLLIYGLREWRDYYVRTELMLHSVSCCGIAARVQGLRRYYDLLLKPKGMICLVKVMDGELTLAEANLDWEFERSYMLALQVVGRRLWAWVDNRLTFEVEDNHHLIDEGAIALVCEEGSVSTEEVVFQPVK